MQGETVSFSSAKILKIIRNAGIYLAFLLIFLMFSILSANFFSIDNLLNIVVQSSIIAIIGIGQTGVILTGGIDLSVGSNVALIGVALGMIFESGVNIAVGILLALLMGMSIGLVNGMLVSFGKIPAFIVTLGMMGITRGLALAIHNGQPVGSFPKAIQSLSDTKILNIPVFILYCTFFFGIIFVVLAKTKFGRSIYAIGGNRTAAWLSGVCVVRTEVLTYLLCGLFTAVGAIMLVARMQYASPTAADNYSMDTIAATIIGGTAMTGGKGNILGTFVGALLLGMLQNGLTLLNVSDYLQEILIGAIIILAVLLDRGKLNTDFN